MTGKGRIKSFAWVPSVAAGLALIVSGCGSKNAPMNYSSTKNVFGSDGRVAAQSGLPYSAIGRINSGCTAFLVAPQLAVTAAHCIVDSATGETKSVIGNFETDYDSNKNPRKSARIINAWVGSYNPEEFRTKDWAILELDKPLGDSLGFLALEPVQFNEMALPYSVAAAGYQMGFENGVKVGVDRDCQIRSIDDKGRLLNDCDSSAGISGGPIFSSSLLDGGNDAKVVALAVSEFRSGASSSVRRDSYEAGYANVGIPLLELTATIGEVSHLRDNSSNRGDTNQAFHLKIAEANQNNLSRYVVQLRAAAPWSRGTFRDDLGKISCSGTDGDCKGIYVAGTTVTLRAPATLTSYRREGVFKYWVCSDARETFPGTNVCEQTGRECVLQVNSDLICSAWYQ